MALAKEITNPVGITTTYHKISNVEFVKMVNTEVDPETNETKYYPVYKIKAIVYSYVDKNIREKAVHLCAERKQIELYASLEEVESTPILEVIYGKLKELEIFTDAVDC